MTDIAGHEGRYAITKDGRVWSYEKSRTQYNGGTLTYPARWLKPYMVGNKGNQYQTVDLADKNVKVHRLVALAYIPNPNNYPHINHKDGNKLNNHVDNLEWCTQKMNSRHAYDNGRMKQFYGEDHKGHKLSTEQVDEIRSKKESGMTLKELSQEYGSSISNISYICRRETRRNG